MTDLIDYVHLAHKGYMDGILGNDPDTTWDTYSEYNTGWLKGAAAKEQGVPAPKFLPTDTLPVQRGMQVTIPKGTPIWGTFKEGKKTAGRNYEVTVHSVDPTVPAYKHGSQDYDFVPPKDANICWVGAGGYWHYALIRDIQLGSK